MLLKAPKKTTLTRHADADVFVRHERVRRPWMAHSVALLIVASRVDALVLTCPQKAIENDAPHVRVPPQGRLRTGGVITTARMLGQEVLQQVPPLKSYVYLGTARGHKIPGGEALQYDKYIHWVAVTVTSSQRALCRDSIAFSQSYWCSAGQLIEMRKALAMSEQKYQMTLLAISAFGKIAAAEGSLVNQVERHISAT